MSLSLSPVLVYTTLIVEPDLSKLDLSGLDLERAFDAPAEGSRAKRRPPAKRPPAWPEEDRFARASPPDSAAPGGVDPWILIMRAMMGLDPLGGAPPPGAGYVWPPARPAWTASAPAFGAPRSGLSAGPRISGAAVPGAAPGPSARSQAAGGTSGPRGPMPGGTPLGSRLASEARREAPPRRGAPGPRADLALGAGRIASLRPGVLVGEL